MGANKRKHPGDSTDELYSNKTRSKPSAIARVDPTYGQRSAIPLDDESGSVDDNGGLAYDEEMDALAYLRSVRREAEGIPNLIVAPKAETTTESRDIYEDGLGDFRGRYEDGAFYAGPDEDEANHETEEDDLESEYFASILTRFHALRSLLSKSPPLEAIQKLDDDHPIYLGKLTAAKVRWWRWKIRTTNPLPAQVATMDKDTVLGLLNLMAGGNLLSRGADIEVSVSRWVWSLLAKLPERGALSSEEIGLVRELGKKAVLVGVWLREGDRWEEGIGEVEADYDAHEDEENYADDGTTNEDGERESWNEDGEVGYRGEKEDSPSVNMETELYNKYATQGDEGSSMIEETDLYNPFTTKGTKEIDEIEKVERHVPEDLAAAKARMLGLLDDTTANIEQESPVPADDAVSDRDKEVEQGGVKYDAMSTRREQTLQSNSNATVDMILTIAGEVYGQRDLLEFRGFWDNEG